MCLAPPRSSHFTRPQITADTRVPHLHSALSFELACPAWGYVILTIRTSSQNGICAAVHAAVQDVMDDPVVAADGYTYERLAIEEWVKRSSTSPLTNMPLPHGQLVTNLVLRSAIREWSEQQARRRQQQQQGPGAGAGRAAQQRAGW